MATNRKINSIRLSGGETYDFDLPSNAQISISDVKSTGAVITTASIENLLTPNLITGQITNNFTTSGGGDGIKILADVNAGSGKIYMRGSDFTLSAPSCTLSCSTLSVTGNVSANQLRVGYLNTDNLNAKVQSLQQYPFPAITSNLFHWKRQGTTSNVCALGTYLVIRKGTGTLSLNYPEPSYSGGNWQQITMSLYPVTIITTSWNSYDGTMSFWVYSPDSAYEGGSFSSYLPVTSGGYSLKLNLTTSNALVIRLQ